MKPRVLFLVTNPIESPGERYRIYQFLPYLEAAGIVCVVHSLFSDDNYEVVNREGDVLRKAAALVSGAMKRISKLLRAQEFDAVVSYRQPIALWPGSAEALLARFKAPYIFDFDDAIYLPPPSPTSSISTLLRPPRLVRKNIELATVTVVAGDHVAAYARRYSSRVEVIPTCVDTERYPQHENWANSGPIVVGWIGSRSTSQYLHVLDDVWQRLAHKDRVIFRVIGGSYAHSSVRVEEVRWSLETEAQDVAGFDIGVMPLPDDEWTRGKGGLKLLQYMAAGVPAVGSSVGGNAGIIRHGIDGMLASSTEEWIRCLDRLTGDPNLRRQLGGAGKTRVTERYSLSRWAPRWAELLFEVTGTNRQ
jgi:glycosyltransferase involved in cell wall biosynthesis